MTRAIWLDMDGTIADLYGVEGWLICLRKGDISPYGTDKYSVCGGGILFDDEEQNRKAWKDVAYSPDHLIDFLKKI